MKHWQSSPHRINQPVSVGQGSLGTEKLREELEAENEGIKIPSAIRWLDRAADVKALFKQGAAEASSVTSQC